MKKPSSSTINPANSKMHNHLENNWNLSNKKALFYNMRDYYENMKEDYSKYLPSKIKFKSHISHLIRH